ncbi:LytTR family DNA-binding domain-containing protein [Parabacteroides gordonii]|jgi:DNA-binding LytR/AlgR family response regulator|uniref:LytR/AlgR family response regulator transcription factor n=1 Tax=Parabacteroides gordonii TaxID=574930 RepID=UPI00241CD8A6|nr:LytTR family DNA-binding domain-containing protein [Parabacteroides gordonii]
MNTLNFKEQTQVETAANASSCTDKNTLDNIFIKIQDHFRKISFNDILYIEASGSYCNFYLQTGKITVAYTLAETMQHLSELLFIRVHRSFIINKNHVTSYIGNTFYIGEHMIPIGRQYKKEILSHFNILGTIS